MSECLEYEDTKGVYKYYRETREIESCMLHNSNYGASGFVTFSKKMSMLILYDQKMT